ncbi:MAG: squalene synthase HpnC [Isosphaeraceae bacterium]|nr:squalene synthase HpnC [Isosphaeraceae bacterium]
MPFAEDLRRYGPDASYRLNRDEAWAYCARLTATHYENFSVITWLTPRALRPAMQAVYSFCRWSDDLGDEVGDRDEARRLLAWWRGELRALYRGEARHPVLIALGEVIAEYSIPIGPFEALISAFEQDQEVLEYETYEQLIDYCTRSANPVGHLVLYLGRVYNEENVRLADCTCTALQLANFWQDVARDLAIGRIYLPREDRERFGYPESDLRALRFSPAFAALMRFEVERARGLFREGWPLVARLPGRLAVDVDLFTRGGLAILDRIERRGFDVLSARPEVSRLAKVGLLLRSIATGWWRGWPSPPLSPGRAVQVQKAATPADAMALGARTAIPDGGERA